MKTTVSSLKKVIRKALREHQRGITPEEAAGEAAYTAGEAALYAEWNLAYEIAVKLMYTPRYKEKQVADQMSGGLYSRDPKFKHLVDGLYAKLEDEASGP